MSGRRMGSLALRLLSLMAAFVATVAAGVHPSRVEASSGRALDRNIVTGTITYRERVALPPDAVAELRIIDATTVDAKAPPVASVTVPFGGAQVPLPFSLQYDERRIVKSHLYTIRASIASNGELLFATDIARSVITQGNPTNVDLVLSRVDPTESTVSASVSANASGELEASAWVLKDFEGDAVLTDTRITLDFNGRGRVTGSGSCNRYSATVELSGSSIRVGAVGAARTACATAVSLQEVRYFESLEGANRFTLEGGVLSIYGAARRPMRFERAAP